MVTGERDVSGLLLAIGTAAMVPLVMIRVGWLSAQRMRAEGALIHQATHDALTGLANRVEFMSRVTAALDRYAAGADRPAPAVLFCDLNGFKAVNDRLGHAVGDQLLQLVGSRLAGCVRQGETLARYGGDEFVILCADPHEPLVVDLMCARITAAFSQPFTVVGEQVEIGVSVGAVTATPGADAASVVRRADEAMYVAKRNRQVHIPVSLKIA
jgi:diguanylate cyclase (GGDEF)-like protein